MNKSYLESDKEDSKVYLRVFHLSLSHAENTLLAVFVPNMPIDSLERIAY